MQLMKLAGMQACCSSINAQAHNVHTHKHTQTHTHAHTRTHTNAHTCTGAHTHTGAHTQRHMHMHMHMHTRAHTHTHAHTLAIAPKQHAKLAHACNSSSSSESNKQEWLEKGWLLNDIVK